jgi:hypothetical protein
MSSSARCSVPRTYVLRSTGRIGRVTGLWRAPGSSRGSVGLRRAVHASWAGPLLASTSSADPACRTSDSNWASSRPPGHTQLGIRSGDAATCRRQSFPVRNAFHGVDLPALDRSADLDRWLGGRSGARPRNRLWSPRSLPLATGTPQGCSGFLACMEMRKRRNRQGYDLAIGWVLSGGRLRRPTAVPAPVPIGEAGGQEFCSHLR